jgi:hypothetical protein
LNRRSAISPRAPRLCVKKLGNKLSNAEARPTVECPQWRAGAEEKERNAEDWITLCDFSACPRTLIALAGVSALNTKNLLPNTTSPCFVRLIYIPYSINCVENA